MTSGAIRAATDVGGTFTDLVYFSTDPLTGVQEIVTAKSDTTPPDFEQGVMNVLRKSGVSLEEIAFLRARHDDRHQRDHRAQGRQGRAAHDATASATFSRSAGATGRTSSTWSTASRALRAAVSAP